MTNKRFALQHYDGPNAVIYDEASDLRLGNPAKTLVEQATAVLGGAAPADTDAAIDALVTAGYRISIGGDRTTKIN